MATNHLKIILNQINVYISNKEINDVLTNLKEKENKIVILNNSFLFRGNIKTKKSHQYLAIIPDKIPIDKSNCFIVTGPILKNNYIIKQKNDPKIISMISIEDAIQKEQNSLGEIVFVLMGEIDENTRFSEEIDHTNIKKITYCPKEKNKVKVNKSEIVLNDLENEEENWKDIELQLNQNNNFTLDSISELKQKIGKVFDSLKKESYLNLRIPLVYKNGKDYFLDLIIKSIEEQLKFYKDNVQKLNTAKADRQYCLNEVLRISYNFADDASTLIKLVVHVCDLKPIILWETYYLHYELDESIRLLPWRKQNTKPSLDVYINTIKKARNKTFHRLIPFSKAFEVALPDNSIKNANLRIFSEFGSKANANRLDYTDKELIDVLMEFKRTSEEIVTDDFWIKNCHVIETTIKLLRGIANTIRGLR